MGVAVGVGVPEGVWETVGVAEARSSAVTALTPGAAHTAPGCSTEGSAATAAAVPGKSPAPAAATAARAPNARAASTPTRRTTPVAGAHEGGRTDG